MQETQDTMATPSRDITEMHNTHTQWRSEHAAWMDELASWRREQQQTAVTLYKLEHALPEHRSQLDTHADLIKMHEKQINDNEKMLARLMACQGDADAYTELLKTHKAAIEKHKRIQQQHDEIRQTHLAAMAELKRLAGLFEKP